MVFIPFQFVFGEAKVIPSKGIAVHGFILSPCHAIWVFCMIMLVGLYLLIFFVKKSFLHISTAALSCISGLNCYSNLMIHSKINCSDEIFLHDNGTVPVICYQSFNSMLAMVSIGGTIQFMKIVANASIMVMNYIEQRNHYNCVWFLQVFIVISFFLTFFCFIVLTNMTLEVVIFVDKNAALIVFITILATIPWRKLETLKQT